jgi:hypothetical protein
MNERYNDDNDVSNKLCHLGLAVMASFEKHVHICEGDININLRDSFRDKPKLQYSYCG